MKTGQVPEVDARVDHAQVDRVGQVRPAGGDEPQRDRDDDRRRELRARAEPERAAPDDLRVVVGEPEQRTRNRDAEHADGLRRELRQQQERHRDRREDDDAAHRRGPRLGVVLLRALLADVLAELARPQERDEPGRQEDADEQGRRPRDQDLAHQPAACSASVTTSSPTPRDALTSTTSPGPTTSGSSAAASAASRTAWGSASKCSSIAAARAAGPPPGAPPGPPAGAGPGAPDQADPGRGGVGADVTVVLALGGAEL